MGLFKDIQTDLEQASVRMVTEYRDRLLVEAFRLCGNQADAEDLVGSVFKEVFAHNGGYDPEKGELYSYLSGILSHLYARSKRRAVNRGTVAVDPSVLAEDESLATSCTDDEIFSHSDHDALREAIQRLPANYRDAVLLHYFSELPIVKVARILGISDGTVKWRLSMARKALADDLGRGLSGLTKPLAVLGAILLGVVTLFGAYQLAKEGKEEVKEEWRSGILSASEQDEPSDSFLEGPQATDNASDERFDLKQENTIQGDQSMNKITNAVAAIAATTVLMANSVAAADTSAQQRYDVYLLAGQSNMCGRGPLPATPYDLTNVQIWNGSAWVQAVEPFFHDKSTAGAGLAASFARKMADAEPGVVVRLVPTAVGDTAMSRWIPEGDLYQAAVAMTRAAVANGGGTLKGILWHQGEGDAGNYAIASSYSVNLKRMVAQFRTDLADLTGGGSLRFVAGELGRYFGDPNNGHCVYWQTINNQLRTAVKELADAYLISSEGLTPKDDNIHFDTPSLRTLGERYSVAFLNPSALPVLEPPTVPDRSADPTKNVSTLDYVQDGLVAQWDGVENAGRFRHSDAITVWKDIVGGSEISLLSDTAIVGTNFVRVLKSKEVVGSCPELGIGRAKTIELCVRCKELDGTDNGSYMFLNQGHKYVLSYGASRGYEFTYYKGNNTRQCLKGLTVDFDSLHTFSCGYPGNEFRLGYDGHDATQGLIGTSTATAPETGECHEEFQLGRTGRPGSFEYYSIRIYSRVLTDEEIAHNHMVDHSRFVDGNAGWNGLLVRGDPAECGDVTPAYGMHTNVFGGMQVDCAAFPPQIPVGQTNIVCAGYVAYTNGVYEAGQEYLQGTESNFHYVQPENAVVELVWQWKSMEDPTLPNVIDLTAESVNPDELVVRGNLVAMTGASCSLSVIVSGGGLSEPLVFEGLAGSERTATGEFALTVTIDDPDSPQYLRPDVTYEVKVLAKSGDRRSLSAETATVKMFLGVSAASYVQDGLVTQWDGVENAGRGQHAEGLVVWKDLIGDSEISLSSDTAIVGTNFVRVLKSKEIAGSCPELGIGRAKAIELCVRCKELDGTDNGSYMFLNQGHKYVLSYGTSRGYEFTYYKGNNTRQYLKGLTVDFDFLHTFSCGYPDNEFRLGYDGHDATQGLIGTSTATAPETRECHEEFQLGRTGRPASFEYYSIRIYSKLLTPGEIMMNRLIDQVRYEGVQVEDVLPEGMRMLANGTVQCRTEIEAHGAGVRCGGATDVFVTGRQTKWSSFASVTAAEAETKSGWMYAWVGAPRTGAAWTDDGATMTWKVDGAVSIYLDAFAPSTAVRHIAPGETLSLESLRNIKSLHVGALQGETGVAMCQLCGQVEVTAANGGYAIVEAKGSGKVRSSVFTLLRGGKLKLLADAIINDLEMPDAADTLDLNGHKLTIRSMTHKDRAGWEGTVVDSAGGGQIVWDRGAGLVLMVW